MTRKRAIPTLLLVGLTCLYAFGFGLLAARAFPAHETNAFDLGVYDQALWNAARGRGLSLTLVPHLGPTRFAIHVEPILFLLVPIYRFLTDDPRFLLWLQAVVLALGALPLYGLARRRLGSEAAALALAAAYLLLPALESVTLFEFHAVGLAPSLLLSALYFLDRALVRADDPRGLWIGPARAAVADLQSPTSNWVLSGLFFVLALGTKEDVSLHVFMAGLYVLALRRRWRPGLALMLVGLAWFYVAFYVVIPASRPAGAGSAYTGWFDALGDTPIQIALSPVREPGKVGGLLLTLDNARALGMLTLPLALTPLVGLPLFVLAAPTLAITLLSSNPLMHQLETYHYAAPALPFVILGAVDGIARLSNLKLRNRWIRESGGEAGDRSAVRRVSSTLLSPYSLSLLVLLVSLVYHYYRGYSPLARPFHWPEITAHQRLGDELAASIPPEAPVVAQAELVPLLDQRPWVQIWQGPFDERAEYLLLDTAHPAFVNRKGAQESFLSDMAQDPAVGPIATMDGYVLLKRGAPRKPTTPEFFTFAYVDPPADAVPVSARFGDSLHLVAFETHRNYADREAEPLVTLYWEVLSPPAEDYLITIFLLDEAGRPVGATLHQQPLTVWWPTSRWEPGRTMRMLANTFPWWTGDRRYFGYGLAVVQDQGTRAVTVAGGAAMDEPWWRVPDRLPVIREDGGPAPLDSDTLLPLTGFRRVASIPYPAPFLGSSSQVVTHDEP